MNSIQLMMDGQAGIFIPETETTEVQLDEMMKESSDVLEIRGRTKEGGKIVARVVKSAIKGTIHVEEFTSVAKPGSGQTPPSRPRIM